MSTETYSENHFSQAVTASTPGRISLDYLIPYDIATVVIGILGIFANGIVLGGFWLSRRSKMTSSMLYIANQTTLELVSCIMITINMLFGLAGAFRYNDSGPSATAMCILVDSSTLFTLGLNGSTACLVIMTLDRFWKIVHAVHHRNHHRRWMLYVGLFLPWLNGIAVHLLPALGTTRVWNGICMSLAFWPSEAMARGYGVFMFLWQFFIPMIIFITAYWKILKVVKNQGKVGADRALKPADHPVAGTSRRTTEPGDVDLANDEGGGKRKVSKVFRKLGSQSGPKKLSQTQINVVKTMTYITVCFTLCWMPMYFYLVLSMFGVTSRFDDPAGRMVQLAAYCQILLNPLIYISRYEVIKRSLISFVQKITAVLREPTTIATVPA